MKQEPSKVLVIDDERPVLLTLEAFLQRRGFNVHASPTATAGLAAFRRWHPDLVLLDLGLPDAEGMEVLKTLKAEAPSVQVLILTANDSIANAIDSIKAGAFHFISKPYAPEELVSLMMRALKTRELEKETTELREESARLASRLAEAEARTLPVFHSRSMKRLEDLLKRVAPTDANVLLLGESGVGKEVLANRIHSMSRRASRPLIKLNCAAFPANMIEAELFGYVKGAFTGAVTDFKGMIAESEGGTLFLDEVAEMPAELQTRFLRVLQEREYRPLGTTKTVKVDFRLVAATNRRMPDAIQSGVLRQDLYYRLNTFQVEIPPLRERREDIPSLVARFAGEFASRHDVALPHIRPDAMERLCTYSWPGNIRELQNAVEYAVVLADSEGIGIKQLPAELHVCPVLRASLDQTSDGVNLEARERQAILEALVKTGGNKKRAAEALGIQRPTLYAKLRRYGMLPAG